MENLTENPFNLDKSNNLEEVDEFEWIRSFEANFKTESFQEKIIRKTKENPAVPIGTMLTAAALVYGLWNFNKGNKMMSQYMMRARVGMQAFTILSIAGGFIYLSKKKEK